MTDAERKSTRATPTCAGMRRVKVNANAEEYELCVSCAYKLRKWFDVEENDNG